MSDFLNGKQAFFDGKSLSDNPYICGKTKLGADKFSDLDAGCDWENGFRSAMPARKATKQELIDAETMDISKFRKKSNRHYA